MSSDTGSWMEGAWSAHKRYLIIGFLTVAFLIGGMGGWSVWASISGAVIAQGVVVVDGKPKTIQHLDGGVIKDILVEDGSRVEAGEVLVRLDATRVNANLAIVESRLYEASAEQARLFAERDDATEITVPELFRAQPKGSEAWKIFEGQQKLFEARRATRDGQISQLRQQIGQLGDEIAGLQGLQASKRKQIGFVEKELKGLRALYKKGHATLPRLLSLEREAAKLEGEISELGANIARARNQIGEAEIQILQVTQDFREKVLSELREASSQLRELQEQKLTIEEQMGRIDIKAPVAGLVHGMSVHTVGGVVSPAEPLMQVVPYDERLIIEAQIDPQSIDQVHANQDAVISFPAFNRKTTPELNGTVLKVSADRLENPQTGMPYFLGVVEIPEAELARLKGVTLVPGMPASVFIQTGDRSALSYLVKPLTDQIKRAFREE